MRILVLLSLFITSFSILNAQKRNEEPQLRAKIRFLAWDVNSTTLTPTLWSAPTDNSQVPKLHCYDRSAIIKYNGSAILTFTSNKDIPTEKNTRKISINTDWKDVLILIKKTKNHPSGIQLIAINDSSANFPWGSYKLVNGTNVDLKVSIDKNLIKLPARAKPHILRVNRPNGTIQILATAKKAQKPLFACITEHHSKVRNLVIFTPQKDKRLGVLAARIIPENKPIKKESKVEGPMNNE